MEKLYIIKDNIAEITISKALYPLITIKKAVANYMEDVYIKLEEDKDNIIIKLQLQENKEDLERIVGEFYNELLRESLRYDISCETKNLRELIVARALYTTCIDVNENEEILEEQDKKENNEVVLEEEFNIDDIAVNWFDTNNNKEE